MATDQNSGNSLKKKWATALSIILSPAFLLSTIITVVTLFLSIKYKSNVPFSNLMTILGSVFGSIAGAFFKDELDKQSGKNILEKKGRSALRNLEGIGTQLCNIKDWVVDFGKRAKRLEDRRVLEEINRHITTIELSIASGVEDWVDIVPELKESVAKEQELDRKYKEFIEVTLRELIEKRKELVNSKDKKVESEIKSKISDLEKQIKKVQEERSRTITSVGGGTIAATGGSSLGYMAGGRGGSAAAFTMGFTAPCSGGCGKVVLHDLNKFPTGYCDDCRTRLGI